MTNWQPIIDHFFRMSDPEGDCDPYCPPGASDEVLVALEAALGVTLPPELRDFYRHCDGLGLVQRDSGSMPLFVRPTHELVEFIASSRASFSETHPQLSNRYFPCIDWNNGDSSGFILDRDGRFLDGIYTFSHEGYSFDASQDVNDFLFEQANNLASLLHPE